MNQKIIIAGEDLTDLKEKALSIAGNLADWLLACQMPENHFFAESGTFYCSCGPDGKTFRAANWNLAFAIMGLLSAYHHFGEAKYRTGAERMARYLKSLQIFTPFHPEYYGCFREMSPQTPWCYVRDTVSAAWAMLELYRETADPEYLERAMLWYKWFRQYGMDRNGWPLWRVQFEKAFDGPENAIRIHNGLHGCFHGGSLNFFYQMYRQTGNEDFVGDFYRNIADKFVSEIQQADGFFRSVEALTGKVPDADPQQNLHRGNDDLGTLGLAGAFRVTGKEAYRESLLKFFRAVFARQGADGGVEASCAPDPVILNAVFETQDILNGWAPPQNALRNLLRHLFFRQVLNSENPLRNGSFDESGDGWVCARSACYALIVLLKIFGNGKKYLTAE